MHTHTSHRGQWHELSWLVWLFKADPWKNEGQLPYTHSLHTVFWMDIDYLSGLLPSPVLTSFSHPHLILKDSD